MRKTLFFLFACLVIGTTQAQKKDLAATPPMGWNSWNHFNCNINEYTVKEIADAMATSGMAEAGAGYEYIVIDDCWQIDRYPDGKIIADPAKFPSGIKALADYIHSKGLKFGIYSDAGKKTCQERPGSWQYEAIDAQTYAEWGVDYIKYDWCHHGLKRAENTYPIMGEELYKLDRDIVYSVCNWGWGDPWEWAPEFAHLWRTTWDIEPCFDCRGNLFWKSVENIVDLNAPLAKYARPGAWNDPDMLEVGNGDLSYNENVAHFSLWCMMASPLIAGNDLRNMDEETLSILTNKEMIAIDQDPLGIQGFRIYDNPFFEIWLKPLKDGSKAVCFFNRGDEIVQYSINWKKLLNLSQDYQVRNIWDELTFNSAMQDLEISLRPNSVVVFRLDPKD